MTLREKRVAFTMAITKLIQWASEQGYEVALGPDGLKHMKNSLHYVGLAVDLNVYRDGVYLIASEQYRPLGEYFKTLHQLARWGGEFGDGNHFSFKHEGRK
jgi:hypothetical protein